MNPMLMSRPGRTVVCTGDPFEVARQIVPYLLPTDSGRLPAQMALSYELNRGPAGAARR